MDTITCKKCGANHWVKNGFVREIQRYRCKECGCNFTATAKRGKGEAMKALATLLYGMGKGKCSFNEIGRLLGVSGTAVYQWVRREGEALPEPVPDADIREMELDELRHFIGSKKTNAGFGKPWTVARGVVSPGLLVVVMLQPFDACGKK